MVPRFFIWTPEIFVSQEVRRLPSGLLGGRSDDPVSLV
jgi:hypothetical protein